MSERPTSAYLTSEHFDWLVDLLARYHEGRRCLRWLQEHVRPQGDGFLVAPPGGDFRQLLQTLSGIHETLAQANEIAFISQYLEGANQTDEIVAQRMMATLEEALEDLLAEADRVDILRNVVFYRVGPDYPE